MAPQCALDDTVNTEVLLKIFGYLNLPDLCHLRQTCKRFNEIISCWDQVLLKNVTPLATNQRNTIFSTRCLNKLTTLEKCRISHNWQKGRYKEKSLLYTKNKYMPFLHLTKESIWISRGKKIFNYRRDNNNIYVDNPICSMWGRSKADIRNFQIKNDLLISGQRDGSMWLSSLIDNRRIFDLSNCHDSDINSVDICPNGNYVVSGSRDNCFKLWRLNHYGSQEDALEQVYCQYLEDRIWKVAILDDKPLIAVGTSGNYDKNSLLVYDMQRLTHPMEIPSINYGFGVLDIKWDGPHTIWSCGYDTHLRRWDLRTGKCEQHFSDPHRSILCCLDYDYCNTIITGTQQGRVVLWDIRQPHSIQIFFMKTCKDIRSNRSSPIHSLAFDSEFLFTTTDHNLSVRKFSDYDGIVKDYFHYCRVY